MHRSTDIKVRVHHPKKKKKITVAKGGSGLIFGITCFESMLLQDLLIVVIFTTGLGRVGEMVVEFVK